MPAFTYQIEANPPPPLSWDEYKSSVESNWTALINSPAARDEKNIQAFLEEHPCMIVGAFGITFSSGHFPFPHAVISQPVLKGLNTKIPDFMWLAADSGTIYPVLIEIETPTKRWFTREGHPHSDFTQAHTQLASWKTWFNSPVNQQIFLEYYQIPSDLVLSRRLHPLYVLVYGSRDEFEAAPTLNSMRASLERADETLMTFHRLAPDGKARDMMCVKLIESPAGRRYEALTVPPTLTLGPLGAHYRAKVFGKEEAVSRNTLIGKERKAFLISRIPYWDDWVQGSSGYYSFNTGDRE